MCANRRILLAAGRCGACAWRPCAADVADGERHRLRPRHRPPEPKRVALIIGNGSYPQSPIASAPADARAFADVLREGGFDVVYAENARAPEIEAAIGAFTKKLGLGRHGRGIFRRSCRALPGSQLPAGGRFEDRDEADIRAEGIDIDLILDPLIVSRPAGSVVILDAARKNPWQQAISPRLRGLSSQPPISGVTVVYPAFPGEVVGDTPREANLFAVELIKSAKVQGLPFKEVLRRVRTAVAQATRDRQMLWESSPTPRVRHQFGAQTGSRRQFGRAGFLGDDQGQRQRG